jgi:UDP-N-acetylmuramoylalanine--D-glutamate ligase
VYPYIVFKLGGHDAPDFTEADIIIKAAGVPLDAPEIATARAAGVPVFMSTALAAHFARGEGATIVGITGTRGKSTVTQMVFHVLVTAGIRAHLGGNVRGVSTLALLPRIEKGDILVLELDSWQLQGFGDFPLGAFSPDIAVFTNFMPDHQNYYPDMQRYFYDKQQIYAHQDEDGVLIAGRVVADEWIKESRTRIPIVYSGGLRVPGAHNRENAALAAEALRALGLSEAAIAHGLETFEAVEGRLQLVREVRGVRIYNDNNATTPEATIAALHALAKGRNVILIMGGSDKGLDMNALLYEIAQTCKRVLLLAGTGTDRIAPLMQDYSIFDSIGSAVREAAYYAEPGDIILFSPAFASFGLFRNEYDRNDQFMRVVASL